MKDLIFYGPEFPAGTIPDGMNLVPGGLGNQLQHSTGRFDLKL